MALTKVSRGLLSTGIVDNSNATAITIDSSENVGIGMTPASTVVLDIKEADASTDLILGLTAGTGGRVQIRSVAQSDSTSSALSFHVKTGGSTSEAARIDSSNVLVGKTSVGLDTVGVEFSTGGRTRFTRNNQNVVEINRKSSNGSLITFNKDGTSFGSIQVLNNNNLAIMGSVGDHAGIQFGTHSIVPMEAGADSDGTIDLGSSSARFLDLRLSRIMYSGTARIGTTTQQGTVTIDNEAVNTCLTVHQTSTSVNYAPINVENEFVTGGSTGTMIFFKRGDGTIVGSITSTTTATAYATGSDQRLKDNIVDAADAGSKVDAIKVRQFDWKTDGSHQDYGMVAQELHSVAPEAVIGNADSDDMMMVDYSKLVPMLIKEIQSLRSRVAQLET